MKVQSKQADRNGTGGRAYPAGQHADPPSSMTWRIHSERIVLLGWGRAILLQFAHPLVAASVAEHSPFRTETWGRLRRLRRTLAAMLRLTFGTPEEVARTAGSINAMHDRVHGRLGASAGVFPMGTPYSARDPSLLRWVHGTLVESHLLAYEGYSRAPRRDRAG